MWDKKPNTITKVQNKIKGGKKLGEYSALCKDVVYDSVINSQNRPIGIILVLASQYGF